MHSFSSTISLKVLYLTKSCFLWCCNEIWHPLGYPHTTSYCFRIGSTTEHLIAGTPPDVIKATVHWSSNSFIQYWRSLNDIAPHHICCLHAKKQRYRFIWIWGELWAGRSPSCPRGLTVSIILSIPLHPITLFIYHHSLHHVSMYIWNTYDILCPSLAVSCGLSTWDVFYHYDLECFPIFIFKASK